MVWLFSVLMILTNFNSMYRLNLHLSFFYWNIKIDQPNTRVNNVTTRAFYVNYTGEVMCKQICLYTSKRLLKRYFKFDFE